MLVKALHHDKLHGLVLVSQAVCGHCEVLPIVEQVLTPTIKLVPAGSRTDQLNGLFAALQASSTASAALNLPETYTMCGQDSLGLPEVVCGRHDHWRVAIGNAGLAQLEGVELHTLARSFHTLPGHEHPGCICLPLCQR